MSLERFRALYSADPFYSWVGLDNPMMYAAHKAAGGMTSIYRQIGIGCERLFRAILQDELKLSEEEVCWSYNVTAASKKVRTLTLDGRIPLESIADGARQKRVREWMAACCEELAIDKKIASQLNGPVFEVRQGYKSKDAKRQNADIANAATAYTQAYLPCLMVLSTQIDSDIVIRYRSEKWVILIGQRKGASTLTSSYAFMEDVIGYDLAGFFSRHADVLRKEVDSVLEALLKA